MTRLHTFTGTGTPAHAAQEATDAFNAWASGRSGCVPDLEISAHFVLHGIADWGTYFLHVLHHDPA